MPMKRFSITKKFSFRFSCKSLWAHFNLERSIGDPSYNLECYPSKAHDSAFKEYTTSLARPARSLWSSFWFGNNCISRAIIYQLQLELRNIYRIMRMQQKETVLSALCLLSKQTELSRGQQGLQQGLSATNHNQTQLFFRSIVRNAFISNSIAGSSLLAPAPVS